MTLIESDYIGSKIMVTIRMNLFVNIFMIYWILAASYASVVFILDDQNKISIFPIGMIVFSYLLMQFGFWIEVPKIKFIIKKAIENNC